MVQPELWFTHTEPPEGTPKLDAVERLSRADELSRTSAHAHFDRTSFGMCLCTEKMKSGIEFVTGRQNRVREPARQV